MRNIVSRLRKNISNYVLVGVEGGAAPTREMRVPPRVFTKE
jgi:hypothetical protein